MKNIKKALISLMTCTIIISIFSTFTLTTSAAQAWGSMVLYEDPECTKIGYAWNDVPYEGEPEYHIKAGKEYYLKVYLTDNLLFPFYCDNVFVGKDVIVKGENCMIFTEDEKDNFGIDLQQYGNVDDVWDVDTADALSILKRCAKMDNDGIIHEKSADVDQNGEINTLDSLEILKRITRLVEWERKDETVSSFNFIVKE